MTTRSARFQFFERFHQGAVALGGGDFGDPRGGELMFRVVQDGFALETLDAALGFFEFGQFLGEQRAGVHADAAAEVHARRAFAMVIQHMENFDAGGESQRGPGGVLIKTRGVGRAVGAGEDGWHDGIILQAMGSVFQHSFQCVGFIVYREFVHDGGAGFVEADDFNFRIFAAEFQHHFVQRADGGEIPKMRVAHVNAHLGEGFFEIKRGGEGAGGCEENLFWS